eukprot:CAMPEP_0197022192 /NCGR_PEP_ID=MMETSP1384-20130603/3087_1 /TAXON_ID=29189 /ORGANISM="Ammonia sp." /LENGTH=658 /DNA_ID=CAMNT_0042450181 /DNA_START=31 /DNA_END=2007 /DNA_ORIENTATION=+
MQVMSSVQYQNKKATEPIYELDVTVQTPDITEESIYCSSLTFINVSEGLNKLIQQKIRYAQTRFIDRMTQKNKDVQAHKNLLHQLEKGGLSVIPAIDANEEYDSIEFKSCGDINKDLEKIKNKTLKTQTQLFELDENYYPIHHEIKKLQAVKHDLDEFTDTYKIKMSQINRVLQRIAQYIEDNKTTKESTNEAIKATQQQQALMMGKISEKIQEIHAKLRVAEQKDKESNGSNESAQTEMSTHREYLRGLEEFSSGIQKLQQISQAKTEHLDRVISQLIQQRAAINQEKRSLRDEAMDKLKQIRNEYLKPNLQTMSDEYDQKIEAETKRNGSNNLNSQESASLEDEINNVELPNYKDNPPSTMVTLLHQREKYMSRVYKRIHDLESRALTTSSTEYLNSLTEIRELSMIFNDKKLKYFYTKFVSQCNEIFNDCCLAYQAIIEMTAEINSPIIQQLKGVQMLNSVLNKSNVSIATSTSVSVERLRRQSVVAVNLQEREQAQSQLSQMFNTNTTQEQLEIVVDFVQSLPDREIVVMQVARYLATSLPFRSFILGTKKRKYRNLHFVDDQTEEEKKELQEQKDSIYGANSQRQKEAKQMVKIDGFVMTKIREWMGSILKIYGDNAFNSVKVAMENDVVAQVRPSTAARLIVNCVYGLDVSF